MSRIGICVFPPIDPLSLNCEHHLKEIIRVSFELHRKVNEIPLQTF